MIIALKLTKSIVFICNLFARLRFFPFLCTTKTHNKKYYFVKTDIQIARETPLKHIKDIASEYGIDESSLVYYGKNIAKLPIDIIDEKKVADSNLILMTAMSPT